MDKQHVLVLGMGVSGKAATRFLLKQGYRVTGFDDKAEKLQHDPQIKQFIAEGFHLISSQPTEPYDWLLVSPGVPPSHPVYAAAKKAHKEILGEMELALRNLAQPCIGITGTNGKTTVTMLVAHALKQSGLNALEAGNIGNPLLGELTTKTFKDEILVVELSSFQIDTMRKCALDAAVILNVTPDHLDYYASMDEYAKSKIHTLDCVKPGGLGLVYDQIVKEFGVYLKGKHFQTYGFNPHNHFVLTEKGIFEKGTLLLTWPEPLLDKCSHDHENLAAAYLLCRRFGISAAQFLQAYASFKKPDHRIQHVATIDGITYIDDSKGTNIDAVLKAVASIHGKIVLIAGGVDKGFPYDPWVEPFKDKVTHVCAIGQAAQKIHHQLHTQIPVEICSTLQEAVNLAAKTAKKGETVLLSPGCSSFDMFRDYKHRGELFQQIVHELEGVKQ
jgi:UDP-N-acetylmuramoylalanine--D-glutamate ligase